VQSEPLSRELEEYMESLYVLTDGNKVPAKTTDIAKRLGVSPPSVTEMLQKLDRRELVKYGRYEGTSLTEKGLEVGARMVRRHRLLERFLHDVLRIGKEKVHDQACQLEHDISNEAEEALCRMMKAPEECPDDNHVIPPCNKDIGSCVDCQEENAVGQRSNPVIPLTDLKEKSKGKVTFIRGGSGAVQRLCEMGLTAGTEIKVLKYAPLSGPVEIEVRGSRLVIGRGLARKIYLT
jgi:DtxR family Mn-dependent transcriptional regulator